MKQKTLIVLFLLTSFIVKSQSVNVISDADFDNLKINNAKFLDLKKTKGNQSKVEALLGAVTSYKVDENETYYYFVFKGLKIDFSTMGKSKPYIESFEINSNETTIAIKDTAISIGDNIDKLGTVLFSVGRNGSKSILYSTCEDCDVFINIEFDQTSNLITKISYMDMS
ncbi:hypothetical protein [Tenacibaculum insulae]|uniref:hypothetical protein n=1 Tax=Tenacibaculum insulae TaxID=2029677 RepID=UPI003AB6478A